MQNIKKLFIISLLFFLPQIVFARDYVTEWYVRDFETEIVVNEDSSLLITEKITADCGDLPDKHGIFRILSTEGTSFDGERVKTPVRLLAITDFNGINHKYETIKHGFDKTITWKIGDPNKTVKGENYYQVSYRASNAVYEDVLYWNLVGSFWEMEIDNFKATIHLPENIKKEDIELQLYTGFFGERNEEVSYNWIEENVLEVVSERPLKKREGITLAMFFEEGHFIPHQFSFFELYFHYIFFFIPILAFIILFYIWQLHGKDYKKKNPVVPEFLRPKDLDLLEVGMFLTNGKMKPEFITAIIIDMAVKGALMIKEEEVGKIFKSKKITLQETGERNELTEIENYVLNRILRGEKEVDLETLKKTFPKDIEEIRKKVKEILIEKNLFYKKGFDIQKKLFVIGIVFFILGFFVGGFLHPSAITSFITTSFILFFFSFIMPKRTKEGVELYLYLEGLKEYMVTTEKERQIFYEEKNIFEKLLPYAIIFKITKKWAKKMEEAYKDKGDGRYVPVWWHGGSFQYNNFMSFTSSLNSLSSQISSSTGTGGGAGGGSGGGGGGGW